MNYFRSILILIFSTLTFSQSTLISWGMNDIEGMNEKAFKDSKKVPPLKWVEVNKNLETWRDVFITISNVTDNKNNKELLLGIADQLTDTSITKLDFTSRLIIWDRIISGDIFFEGKGLVVENDLFTTAGRANQILQSALGKNFGYVTMDTDLESLEQLKNKWIKQINGEKQQEWTKPKRNYENIIEDIASLEAFEALIISVQPSEKKDKLISECLKTIYDLDQMPEEPGPEAFCNPDKYSLLYLGMLIGEKEIDEEKDHKWWKKYWDENKDKLIWNDSKGCFVVK